MNDFLKVIIFFTILIIFSFIISKIRIKKEKGSFISYLNVSGISYIVLGLFIGWGFKDVFSGKNLFYISPFLIFLIVYIGFLSGTNLSLRGLVKFPLKFHSLTIFYFIISYSTVFYSIKFVKPYFNIFPDNSIKFLALLSVLSTPFYFYFFEKEKAEQKNKYFIISGISNFIAIVLSGFLFFKNIKIRISNLNTDLSFLIAILTLILSFVLYSLLNSKLKIEEVQTITIGIFAFLGGIAIFSNISAIALAALLGFLYINLPYRIQEYKLTPHLILFEKPIYIIILVFATIIPLTFSLNLLLISLIFLFARFLSRAIFHFLLKLLGYKSNILYLLPLGTLAVPFTLSIYFISSEIAKDLLSIVIIAILINETISGILHSKLRESE